MGKSIGKYILEIRKFPDSDGDEVFEMWDVKK
jgi:hypothetical protein